MKTKNRESSCISQTSLIPKHSNLLFADALTLCALSGSFRESSRPASRAAPPTLAPPHHSSFPPCSLLTVSTCPCSVWDSPMLALRGRFSFALSPCLLASSPALSLAPALSTVSFCCFFFLGVLSLRFLFL